MTVEHLRILCDYNYWAHRQVWDCIMQLDEEQFTRDLAFSHGSVYEQVVHVVAVERLWLSRLNGISPKTWWTASDLPTREVIRARWDEVEADVRAYVDGLRDSDLDEVIEYRRSTGQPRRNTRWEILAHMFNHGTDHRAQIMAMMAQLGGPTVEQDLLFYTRQRRA